VPTNSDANLVLGRIGTKLVGGAMTLDPRLAEQAMLTVAEPLGLTLEEASLATIAVANANMADAIRLISIRRGYDPRDFALVAFGGAGPLHGAALARELSIPTVIVPPNPGVTSAMGCMLVDVQHDMTRMYLKGANDAEPGVVEQAYVELEAEGRARLEAEGVPAAQMTFPRFMDMRYQGQWRSMSVAVGRPISDMAASIEAFQVEYSREHNYRRDDAPVEIYRLQVRAVGITPKPEIARRSLAADAPLVATEHRLVRFDEADERISTAVYERAALPPGVAFEGPAIIDQLDSTTVVPPNTRATVDEWMNIRIDILEV
jgi:N-methylhydantoinase A